MRTTLILFSIVVLFFGILILFLGNKIVKLNTEYKTTKDKLETDLSAIEQCNTLLQERKEELQELDQRHSEVLSSLNKQLQDSKEIIKKEIADYQQNKEEELKKIDQFYDEEAIILQNNFSDYAKIHNQKKEEMNQELAKIRDSIAAAARIQLKEREKQEQINFYKIQLSSDIQNDIDILNSIKNRINPEVKRALIMTIWTSFYYKKVNELCGRILNGSKTVTGIYKITNLLTNQVYIGQSVDIKERIRQHIKCGLGIDTPATNKLYQSMLRDGVDNFSFELLEECSKVDLNERERWYIETYSADTLGLNTTKGNK